MRALGRELIETVILALLIFLALRFSVQNYQVDGPSMEPTLEQSQHLLVNRLVYLRFDARDLARFLPFIDDRGQEHLFPFHPPHRGEIIVFRFPGDESKDFVKRVIGVPGDTVQITKGQVLINGRQLDEPYVTNHDRRDMALVTVTEGSYFVLGDNRRRSDDSRGWGLVPADNVIGRAWLTYWPLDRWHLLQAFRWP